MLAVPTGRPRRLAYLGSPAAAVAPLQALVTAGFDVAIVISQPDKRRGRGGDLMPSPVKAAALDLGIPTSSDPDDVLGVAADLAVVVAYGRLIRPHLIETVPFVNLHFSLLPRWRGAAPVERAILAGDDRTGVCVMQLEETLDTGPVYARVELAIGDGETADELRSRLVAAGSALLVATLEEGDWHGEPQAGEPTYAKKIDPSELEIDWSRPAREIAGLVRIGGAWTTLRGKRLKVHRARRADGDVEDQDLLVPCGDGAVELIEVQPEGKARMAAADWQRGARRRPDEPLGT